VLLQIVAIWLEFRRLIWHFLAGSGWARSSPPADRAQSGGSSAGQPAGQPKRPPSRILGIGSKLASGRRGRIAWL